MYVSCAHRIVPSSKLTYVHMTSELWRAQQREPPARVAPRRGARTSRYLQVDVHVRYVLLLRVRRIRARGAHAHTLALQDLLERGALLRRYRTFELLRRAVQTATWLRLQPPAEDATHGVCCARADEKLRRGDKRVGEGMGP